MRHRLAIVYAAAAAVCLASPSFAQLQDGPDRDVVVSSAGGISKGSYQAGVDWTISEFLRRQRRDVFRDRLRNIVKDVPLLGHALPRYHLRAATGASAGNINALFAAVNWCVASLDAKADIPPEGSLFWKTWVATGTTDLLPKERIAEAAALSRRFFEVQHRDTLRQVLLHAVPVQDCDVRVGLTLTKVQPETVTIDNVVGAIGVQRFAAVFDVVRRDDGRSAQGSSANVAEGKTLDKTSDPWIDFAWNSQAPSRQSYGALALPPRLRDGSREKREERLADVFDYMVASSAFPVAFAPKEINYEAGGLVRPRAGDPVRSDAFSDGGVFDNNPIGLAVRLLEVRRERLPGSALRDLIDVVYSSPSNYRGPLRLARRVVDSPETRTGLGAALQLLTGAIASARDYELQSLRRQIARDTEFSTLLGDRTAAPRLQISSRRGPIIGETLFSFGAFLGRPFREYDFYSGIYDGLEFIARQFVCTQSVPPLADGALDTCVSQVHARLVERDLLELQQVSQKVLTWHLNAEYSPVLAGRPLQSGECELPADATPTSRARLAIMCVVHRALSERLTDDMCDKDGQAMVERLLCPGGLGHVLQELGRGQQVPGGLSAKAAIRTLLTGCLEDQERARLAQAASLLSQGGCAVDQAFSDLVDHPERQVYTLMRRALRNIEAGEIETRSKGSPSVDFLTKVAFSIFRTSTMRYRDGNVGPFEFNRSSSALGGGNVRAVTATAAGILLPNYVHNVFVNNRRDQSALGWQPVSLVVSRHVYLNTQFEMFLPELNWDVIKSDRVWDHAGWGTSIGTFKLPRRKLFPNSLDLGYFRLPTSFVRDDPNQRRNTIRLSSRHVADKLAVTALWWPGRLQVSLGVSDLNGIAYWLLR